MYVKVGKSKSLIDGNQLVINSLLHMNGLQQVHELINGLQQVHDKINCQLLIHINVSVTDR